MGRKRVVVPITPDLIGDLLMHSGEDCIIFSVDSPIPKDATFIGVQYDEHREIFLVCFEHESFVETEWGQILPEVIPTFTTYYV